MKQMRKDDNRAEEVPGSYFSSSAMQAEADPLTIQLMEYMGLDPAYEDTLPIFIYPIPKNSSTGISITHL